MLATKEARRQGCNAAGGIATGTFITWNASLVEK